MNQLYCFGHYDNLKLMCRRLCCRSFTDCIKATISAMKVSQEMAQATDRLKTISEPDQADLRFDNIELDGGEGE